MTRTIKIPKQPKVKEPVRIRYKALSDGSQSVYLDIYREGKRQYEFLKLYLIPETNAAAKAQNKATLAAVNTIKSQRIIELTNNVAGLKIPPSVPDCCYSTGCRPTRRTKRRKACGAAANLSATR